jgi:hypothetical protein
MLALGANKGLVHLAIIAQAGIDHLSQANKGKFDFTLISIIQGVGYI